jgi:carbon monoxide dehydrogenase subunit G
VELSQRVEIPVEINLVWESLNNPEILKQCLKGCQEFEPVAEGEYAVVLIAKVGPVKAKFKGEVKLSDVNPPHSYTLSGAGKGGVAGFVKGGATVNLETVAGNSLATMMTYSVKANVGGKIAQLGARLVNGAARKMADDFFTNFVRLVCDDPDGELEISLETIETAELEKGNGD